MNPENAIVFEWNGDTPLEENIPTPEPATETLPEWYEKLPGKVGGGSTGDSTVKLCFSFGDALRLGYIIPSVSDLEVSTTQSNVTYHEQPQQPNTKIYGRGKSERSCNGSFKAPELRIGIPWKIHTPPGYSTLLTYAQNQFPHYLKPYSILVPTDTYNGPIAIPVGTERPICSLECGDPFVQAIPIKRDNLTCELTANSKSQAPDVYESAVTAANRRFAFRPYYRDVCWERKDTATVTRQSSISLPLSGSEEQSDSNAKIQFVCENEYYDVIPKPSRIDQFPDWTSNNSLGAQQDELDELVQTWAVDAMKSMVGIPSVAKMHVSQTGSGVEVTHSFDEPIKSPSNGQHDIVDQHPQHQLGEHFPVEGLNIVKFVTPWYLSSTDGYSLLVREPFNFRQQYWVSTSGLTDADRLTMPSNHIGYLNPMVDEFVINPGEILTGVFPVERESIITEGYIIPKQ